MLAGGRVVSIAIKRLMGFATVAALIGVAAPALAQSVQARVDRTAISLDEQVTLQISLKGRFDSTRGPDIPDFTVVGRSSGQSISIINGQTEQEQRITLALSPRREGTLTIGAVELLADSRVVASSKPITIRVTAQGMPVPSTPAPTAPDPGASPGVGTQTAPGDRSGVMTIPESEAGKALFLLARAPQRAVYVGEPVYVEYVLYTRADVLLSGGRVEGMPKMKGFVVEALRKPDGDGQRVSIQGVAYDARIQWRGVVMALGPGDGILDPMTLTLSVGDVFSRRNYRVASAPVTLSFLPLPVQGRPADFVDGMVGRFVIKSALDKKIVRVGDSAVLTVEVTGTGNMRALKAPQLPLIDGIRVARVPSADLDELRVDEGGMSGKRTFQYLLTPEREGTFDLMRIDLPFFDGMNGKYDRSRTEPMQLVAVGRAGGGPLQEARVGGDVVGIVEASALEAPSSPSNERLAASWVFAGLAVPVIFLGLAEVVARTRRYRRMNATTITRRKALHQARTRLQRLRRDPMDSRTFWAELDGVVRQYLSSRFDLSSPSMTHEELLQGLRQAGVSDTAAGVAASELENCAFGRFAPTAAQEADRKASVDRILSCLATLEREGR